MMVETILRAVFTIARVLVTMLLQINWTPPDETHKNRLFLKDFLFIYFFLNQRVHDTDDSDFLFDLPQNNCIYFNSTSPLGNGYSWPEIKNARA